MRENKEGFTAKELHDAGQEALNIPTQQLKDLADDEKRQRGNFYRDPAALYDTERDSDPLLQGEQALSLAADLDFLRTALTAQKMTLEAGQKVDEAQPPKPSLSLQNPVSPENLDTLCLPTWAMAPEDREAYKAEMKFELDSVGGYGEGLWEAPSSSSKK